MTPKQGTPIRGDLVWLTDVWVVTNIGDVQARIVHTGTRESRLVRIDRLTRIPGLQYDLESSPSAEAKHIS